MFAAAAAFVATAVFFRTAAVVVAVDIEQSILDRLGRNKAFLGSV